MMYVPSVPFWWEFLSWIDVEFYQILFLHLLRWSWVSLSFLLLMLYITLICTCWAILKTLGWIQLAYGIWSFLYSFAFGFLMFCWGFLHRYLSKILACNFLYFVVSLSGSYHNNGWWPPRMNLGVFWHLQFEGILWKA